VAGNVNYFNIVPADIVNITVSYLEPKDRVFFSFVNKRFYSTLNDSYFKNLFIEKYPFLKEVSEKFFKPITDFHPLCGWKIINCIFPENIVFRRIYALPPSFFEVASASIKKELNNYPMQLETQLKMICGNHDKDPFLLIDRASEKIAEYELELKEHKNAHNDFYLALWQKEKENANFYDQVRSLLQECERTGDAKKEALSKINKSLIDWEMILENEDRLKENRFQAVQEYNNLENCRCNFVEMQKLLLEELKKMETNFEYITATYRSICSQVFANAKEYQAKQSIVSNLKQAIKLIDSRFLKENADVLDKDLLQQIENLINACSFYNVSINIWRDLYTQRSRRLSVGEYQWGEHLDTLSSILKKKSFCEELNLIEMLNKAQENIAGYFIEKARSELKFQFYMKSEDRFIKSI